MTQIKQPQRWKLHGPKLLGVGQSLGAQYGIWEILLHERQGQNSSLLSLKNIPCALVSFCQHKLGHFLDS